ncbi:hypothetical protein QYE76_070470 [Lolium multiflorum]|uniref:Uncharacterized protein n=1 Tax=Lolium multiflorum TaxID=4521 RepID=A0AAD8SKN3_LOLMU|nr:hypothetical protein QYE76_070470 [Lolium multiflorum]
MASHGHAGHVALDTPPPFSLHHRHSHHVQHVAHALLRSPVLADDREDADKPRTTRARCARYAASGMGDVTGARTRATQPRGARQILPYPTVSARRGTLLATRSSPDTPTSCLGDHGRRRERTLPPRPRQYTRLPDHPPSHRSKAAEGQSQARSAAVDPASSERRRYQSLAVVYNLVEHTPTLAGATMEPNAPVNTKFYQLGNGGSLIFEHDLTAVSNFLGRLQPEFHGIQVDDQPGGELQWIITADLRGNMESPTTDRILFSFRESNWLDGLARGLQEALARLCGQNTVRLLASRFAHLVKRDASGVPMALQSHPELRHHAEHLDFMLYHTQLDLDNARMYANQTHLALATHGDAIKHLSRCRNKLRLKCAKKDVTITRLRAQITSLEATVKAQEEQIQEMEEDEAGIDIQGGGAFLSDDDDFEEDEFTEEEDYAFLEPGPDDVVPIDVEDEGSCT